jgi:hypothetical protein
LVYKNLDELERIGLVVRDDSTKVARYAAEHPYALRKLVERERASVDELASKIETGLTTLLPEFNLQSQKPVTHFMEGLTGVEHILEDTLTAREPIYMYADNDTLDAQVADIDEAHAKKRLARGIPKRILMAKTPLAAAYAAEFSSELTQIRLIESEHVPHFYTALYVYDGKVSYLTYKDGVFTSALIYDESLYTLHRFTFEALWQHARG